MVGVSRGILELGRTSSPKIIKVYLLRCSNGAWDEHVKGVWLSQVHSILT